MDRRLLGLGIGGVGPIDADLPLPVQRLVVLGAGVQQEVGIELTGSVLRTIGRQLARLAPLRLELHAHVPGG